MAGHASPVPSRGAAGWPPERRWRLGNAVHLRAPFGESWFAVTLPPVIGDPCALCPFSPVAQPVDATQALNLSAGVSNVKVLRGRWLS